MEWINVEDELPKDEAKVLSFSENEIIVAYRKNECWYSFPGGFYAPSITKWMPLGEFYK